MTSPLLSVCLITYNHGSFIREALDGILMQQVNFPWEIIVADDFSTDETRQIILEYSSRHPALFNLVFQEKNVGPAKNWMDLLYASKAKYIAYMEGDDRWNDPFKLQKQVDFLEANPDYVLSCHDAEVIDQDGHVLEISKLPDLERKDYTGDDLKRGAYILSVTMCFRNLIHEFPDEYFKIKNGDTLLTVLLGEFGACKFQHEINAASYRRHTGGVWSMKSKIVRSRTQANTYTHLCNYFQRQGDRKFALYYLDLLVKKQLDIYQWEKSSNEKLSSRNTFRNTIAMVLRVKGFPSFAVVCKRFLQIKKLQPS